MTDMPEQSHASPIDMLGEQDHELPRRSDLAKRLSSETLPLTLGKGVLLVDRGEIWNGQPGEYGIHGGIVQRTDEEGVHYFRVSVTKPQDGDVGVVNIEYGPEVELHTGDDGAVSFELPQEPQT